MLEAQLELEVSRLEGLGGEALIRLARLALPDVVPTDTGGAAPLAFTCGRNVLVKFISLKWWLKKNTSSILSYFNLFFLLAIFAKLLGNIEICCVCCSIRATYGTSCIVFQRQMFVFLLFESSSSCVCKLSREPDTNKTGGPSQFRHWHFDTVQMFDISS